jgi:hypothetical protein
VAEEAHEAHVLVEPPEHLLGVLEAEAQGLGRPADGLRPLAQEREEVAFVGG